ncbi:hypothetical protein H2202_000014 [Exophiala xenobiotica]|nr:hypothetical protein H2202_000014 [Exophiala xenobiotica]
MNNILFLLMLIVWSCCTRPVFAAPAPTPTPAPAPAPDPAPAPIPQSFVPSVASDIISAIVSTEPPLSIRLPNVLQQTGYHTPNQSIPVQQYTPPLHQLSSTPQDQYNVKNPPRSSVQASPQSTQPRAPHGQQVNMYPEQARLHHLMAAWRPGRPMPPRRAEDPDRPVPELGSPFTTPLRGNNEGGPRKS